MTDEPVGPGWRAITLNSPVYVAANTPVVAGVAITTINSYNSQSKGLLTAITRGNIVGMSDVEASGNGRFFIGAGLNFPEGNYNSSNYWVDVSFQQGDPT